jgi:hypothetical protein
MGTWTLYWSDGNQRRHNYDLVAPTRDVLALLDELDRDPTCGRTGGPRIAAAAPYE